MQPHADYVTGLVTLAILALIVRRTLRTQTVRVWALIAVPIVLIVVAISIVAATPPTSLAGGAAIAFGALAGGALGFARGLHSRVQLGSRPGTLLVQGNVVLVVILIAAFGVRFLVRSVAGSSGLGSALSDALVVFAAASVAVARGMLFFTWRRLVAGRATPAL